MESRALDAADVRIRPEPDVRKRLSGPALRTFFNIAGVWQLSVVEQRGLLGWPAALTYHKYKAGDFGALSSIRSRASRSSSGSTRACRCCIRTSRCRRMRMPNTNPAFGGAAPLTLALNAGIDGLYRIRRLLDARRG